MTDTDFDLDDEPVLTAEGEVAAAICGHQVVMQRGGALTADMLDVSPPSRCAATPPAAIRAITVATEWAQNDVQNSA